MKHILHTYRFWIILTVLFLLAGLLNLLAWNSSTACDLYLTYIFPCFQTTYGRLMSLFPCSVGEYMIVIGVCLVIAAVVLMPYFLWKLHKKQSCKYLRLFYRFFAGVLCFVLWIMTLNCVFLYHASSITANHSSEKRTYTIDELEILRNHIVTNCERLSKEMTRDHTGYVTYDKDIKAVARASMGNLSSIYPRLSGFYPVTKDMMFSVFMSQANMTGYYFPFSLETNVNAYMHLLNYPFTICHELSHFKGYLFEDEANFLAYLACTKSDDPFFQYSGYLNVLYYVNNDYYSYLQYRDEDRYFAQPVISEQVREDNQFLAPGMWEYVEEHALFSTEDVYEANHTFLNSNLQFQGIPQGTLSYSEVVGLLLWYYDGILY